MTAGYWPLNARAGRGQHLDAHGHEKNGSTQNFTCHSGEMDICWERDTLVRRI